MSTKWMLLLLILSSTAFAESKLAVDMNITKLGYQKPNGGVGKAGTIVFKTANIVNNGIVLNINNINNLFDSEIFVRPTFLGFTTQFGNFGVTIPADSILNTINKTELENSKFILDDNQLNFSGKLFTFADNESSAKLNNFRLYCQKPLAEEPNPNSTSPELVKSCLNFMTINGTVDGKNEIASLEYESVNKENVKESTQFVTQVKTFDIRKNQISGNLLEFKSIAKEEKKPVYNISTKNLSFVCAKDVTVQTLETDKMIQDCLNQLKTESFTVKLDDLKEKTGFYLDFSFINVKEKILTTKINNATLSDEKSSSNTYLKDVSLRCRKEKESDPLVVTDVLRDCITFGQISIGQISSDNKQNVKEDSSNKNIFISTNGGAISVDAEVKFLGMTKKVNISGKVALDEKNKKITLIVTETRLPFGINSVKLVMYFLKKDLVSKDITINNNVITIAL